MKRAVAILAGMIGCWSTPKPGTPPPPKQGLPTRPAVDVTPRARALVAAQLAEAVDKGGALLSTFEPSIVFLAPSGRSYANFASITEHILGLNPHDEFIGARIDHLVATGNEDAIAVQFTVIADKKRWEEPIGDEVAEIEISELFTAASHWKAVAYAGGALGVMHGGQPSPQLPDATAPGPLTALLVAPADAADALRADPGVGVVSPGERASGNVAARALLAKLPTMTVHDRPREVHGATWGFVQAHLDMMGPTGGTLRISGQLVAMLEHGRWSVVSVHYLPL
jgi:hypothetical protein